jgi:hypothetical protein
MAGIFRLLLSAEVLLLMSTIPIAHANSIVHNDERKRSPTIISRVLGDCQMKYGSGATFFNLGKKTPVKIEEKN